MSTQHELTRRPLPAGWRWVKLGEVCRQDRIIVEPDSTLAEELPYLSLEHIESNTGRILKNPTERIEDEGKSTTFYFDERHVLYGKLRPYLNKVALPGFAGRCTTEMIPLLPNKDTDREFLGWVLRRRETVDAAMRGKTGSRMPRADMDKLLNLEIPLPPLSEQRRIAAILREQMAAVERARRAAEEQLEAAKALPAAFLRQVFPGPGQPLPAGWRWVKLGEVCEFNYGESLPSHLRRDGKIPVYGSNGIVGYHDEAITNGNTIIIGRKGSIGEVHFCPEPCWPIDTTYYIEETKLPCDLKWLTFSLKALRLTELNKAAAIPGLNREDAYALEIPLPPLSEQRRIAAILREQMAAAERVRKAIEAQLEAINKLPAAILRKAFSGEL